VFLSTQRAEHHDHNSHPSPSVSLPSPPIHSHRPPSTALTSARTPLHVRVCMHTPFVSDPLLAMDRRPGPLCSNENSWKRHVGDVGIRRVGTRVGGARE